jgi:hypothetical protein
MVLNVVGVPVACGEMKGKWMQRTVHYHCKSVLVDCGIDSPGMMACCRARECDSRPPQELGLSKVQVWWSNGGVRFA